MTAYWIVWITSFIFGCLIRNSDYIVEKNLTYYRVYHTKNARFLFVAALFVLIATAGLRYYVGTDFAAYYENYKTWASDVWTKILSLNEPGISLIYSLAIRIKDDPAVCIFSVSAVTLSLTAITLYRNTDKLWIALMLFTTTVWLGTFNGIRQALAVSVLFCGFPALRDKKFWKYAFYVFLAFLCHRSAVVMILLYFIVHRNVTIKNLIVVTVSAIVILNSYAYIFQLTGWVLGTEGNYQDYDYWVASVNIFRTLSKVIPAVFFLIICHKYRRKTHEEDFYLNLLIIHAIIAIVTSNSTALARMCMYSAPFAVISISELTKKLKNNRQIVCAAIILAYWIMQFYEISKSHDLSNFVWVWQR